MAPELGLRVGVEELVDDADFGGGLPPNLERLCVGEIMRVRMVPRRLIADKPQPTHGRIRTDHQRRWLS